MDVSMRGAVSIARRVQDPLAEFVKIDPKAIGVGMYQHDSTKKNWPTPWMPLSRVWSTAWGLNSTLLPQHCSPMLPGSAPSLATRIVEHRDQNGSFSNRKDLQMYRV